MEHFLHNPASVCKYDRGLNTQAATSQKLRKYRAVKSSTYQTDSLKKKVNKKLFDKADFLGDKILSCPSIKLSTSLISILDDVETLVLLLDLAQHFRRRNADVPDVCFT